LTTANNRTILALVKARPEQIIRRQMMANKYNAVAVQKAIDKDKSIGKEEAKAIHALLKGWLTEDDVTQSLLAQVDALK
jgi:hypothetical protein